LHFIKEKPVIYTFIYKIHTVSNINIYEYILDDKFQRRASRMRNMAAERPNAAGTVRTQESRTPIYKKIEI
jgi:hypothetical protein